MMEGQLIDHKSPLSARWAPSSIRSKHCSKPHFETMRMTVTLVYDFGEATFVAALYGSVPYFPAIQ
jgi:hypothetical protein